MTYWIYNMGLPVPVSTNQLLNERKVLPLEKLSRSTALAGSDEENNRSVTIVNQRHNTGYGQANEETNRKAVYYAEHIMSTKVINLPIDTPFDEAWQLFQKYKFRHFPVIDNNNKLAGIISDRDMLSFSSKNTSELTLKDIMKTPVLTASKQAFIREICQIMFNQHIGALPITNKAGKLEGIITRSDILRAMIKHGPVELWV